MKKLAVAISSLVLVGCFQQSPSEKLRSDTDYPDLSIEFWANQQDQDTATWKDAYQYCHEHEAKPNCNAVLQLSFLTSGSKKIKGYGTSGEPLRLPDYSSQGE